MSILPERRGFLRGLATLPLIGGGVVLTGNPVRAAQPVTPGMLATYSAWLEYERRALHYASTWTRDDDFVPFVNPGAAFHRLEREARGSEVWGVAAQLRAPIILAAAGCPLTSAEAEGTWSEVFRFDMHGGGR